MAFACSVSDLDQQLVSREGVAYVLLLVALDVDVDEHNVTLLDEVMFQLNPLRCAPIEWFLLLLCLCGDLLLYLVS